MVTPQETMQGRTVDNLGARAQPVAADLGYVADHRFSWGCRSG